MARRAAAVIAAVMVLFTAFSVEAAVDLTRAGSLTAEFTPDTKSAAGDEFAIYKVGDIDSSGAVTYSGGFEDYPIASYDDSDDLRALAQTMASYAKADKITALAKDKIGDSGTVTFSGLTPGLYLVVGENIKIGSVRYIPSPFLAVIPLGDDYDVDAEVKYDKKTTGGGGSSSTLTRKVLKAWKNDEKETRPDAVTVKLLKDGEVFATEVLNEENNWRHTWTGLDESSDWTLIEENVPEGYSVTVSREGITFLVTNTKSDEKETEPEDETSPREDETEPEEETTEPEEDETAPHEGGSGTPHGDGETEPHGGDGTNTSKDGGVSGKEVSETGTGSGTSITNTRENSPTDTFGGSGTPEENETTEEKLPQTGLLVTPIPIAAGLGMIALLAAFALKKRGDAKRTTTLLCTGGAVAIAVALGLLGYNTVEEYAGERAARKALGEMEIDTPLTSEEVGETVIPDYILNPGMDMPSETIDGIEYIGRIDMPSIGVSLPVAKEWSYSLLKKAPCCYSGSIYKGDMVICGHNYRKHFSGIKRLRDGDIVTFTDIDGNVFDYAVSTTETLAADKIQEMVTSDYPLTLFTCSSARVTRVTVRCEAL